MNPWIESTGPTSATPKPRPALRLVKTQQLSREDWLQVRQQGIGSSDAAAAVDAMRQFMRAASPVEGIDLKVLINEGRA